MDFEHAPKALHAFVDALYTAYLHSGVSRHDCLQNSTEPLPKLAHLLPFNFRGAPVHRWPSGRSFFTIVGPDGSVVVLLASVVVGSAVVVGGVGGGDGESATFFQFIQIFDWYIVLPQLPNALHSERLGKYTAYLHKGSLRHICLHCASDLVPKFPHFFPFNFRGAPLHRCPFGSSIFTIVVSHGSVVVVSGASVVVGGSTVVVGDGGGDGESATFFQFVQLFAWYMVLPQLPNALHSERVVKYTTYLHAGSLMQFCLHWASDTFPKFPHFFPFNFRGAPLHR